MALLLVALGGAVGASLRYGLGLGAGALFGPGWPIGTFVANVLGSFLLGVVTELGEGRTVLGVDARVPLGVGVLGGFTTYSSFNLELLRFVEQGLTFRAALYLVSTVALCAVAGLLGLALSRSLRA